jgi:hypothetical protein
MAASAALNAQIDELVALFNRQSLDLPDGLFDRRSQFLLNGEPFEAMLGRSPSDPLVLMIARGPAGYRFVVKALQHAVPDARIERGTIEEGPTEPSAICSVPLWLSGRLRGTDAPVEVVIRVAVSVDERGVVTRADATLDPVVLSGLREARLRE